MRAGSEGREVTARNIHPLPSRAAVRSYTFAVSHPGGLVGRSAISLVLLLASAGAASGQVPTSAAPTPVPQGAFVGRIRSSLDSLWIQLVDIRLFFIDSTREVTLPSGAKTLDTFIDTVRSRIGATDSTGWFAIWRLNPGHYLMQARRIGFTPLEAFVTIDTETVLHGFTMEPIAALPNKVEIHEVSEIGRASCR